MPHDITGSYIQQFDDRVHQLYQEKGSKLRNAVRLRTGVTGEAHSFPVYGKGAALDRGAMASVVGTMGVTATKVKAILADFVAPEYSDIFQQAKINYDDETQLQMAIAKAMGRKEDQVIIDELAQNSAKTIPATFEDRSTAKGLTVAKIRRAKRLLDNDGVDPEDRYFVVTPGGIEALLGETEVTSADYNSVRALVQGEVDTFLGFKFIMIADCIDAKNAQLGLPGVGSADRKYFAFHKEALGLAIGIDHRTEINYVAERTSWLVNGVFSAGAKTIDATGIVEVNVKEIV